MDRRSLLQRAGAGLVAAAGAVQAAEPPLERRIALFMDCLDHLDLSYREAAGHVRDLGFAGPDLTVRGGGVVAPEQAATELPRALAAFREAGLSVPMLSTNLTAAEDPTAEPILRGMQAHGVRFFKLGYLHYRNVARWQVEVEENRRRLRALGQLAARYGAQAGLHNHAGGNIGGAIWDGWELLAPLSPEHFGFYFDAGQATIEGGEHAWKLNFHRIVPRLKMVAIKDFVWEKREGRWRTRWVPLGEGMVRWPEFFALLRGASFPGPVSLHIEYDPGGNTRTEKIERTLAAAARDLTVLRRFLDAAPTPRPNS